MSEEINNSIEHIAKCEMYDVIEVNFLKKKFDDLQQKVEQLEKENEKLKYLVDDSHTMKAFIVEHNKVEQLEKEIDRLNNIINGLEEYINHR